MTVEDFLQPSERIVATCGSVYATNQRLLHYTPGSKSMSFREYAYSQISGLKLVPKARVSTVVLGFLVAVLSLLAGPGSPFQLAVAAVGIGAMGLGLFFGDRYLEVAGESAVATVQWRLREASRKDSRAFVDAVQATMAAPVEPERAGAASTPVPKGVPRSVLLAPADQPSEVRSALDSEADVLCLDLTALVHSSRRDTARLLAWSEVAAAARSAKGVWARISREATQEDLKACVWPGLSAIVVAVDSADGVRQMETVLAALEAERGVPEQVGIIVSLETAAAVWAVRDLLTASSRVQAVVVEAHDLLSDPAQRDETPVPLAGLRSSFPDRAYVQSRIMAGATEAGVPMLGALGAGIAPGHLTEALGPEASERLARAAELAREDGFQGAVTFHQEAVGHCNAVFPGAAPKTPAFQPPPPLPAKWQPVVPSHFGIGVQAPPPVAVPPTASSEGADLPGDAAAADEA